MMWTNRGLALRKHALEPEELHGIRNDLTVRPFTFGFGGENAPTPSFEVFQEDSDFIYVPRFWAADRFQNERELPVMTEAVQTTEADWTFNGELRAHQKDIIDTVLPAIRDRGGGVLSVVCGAGKTCMAIHLMSRLGVKTLVVVNKSQLLQQWRESISKFLGPDFPVGIIQQKTVDADKPVVLGMLQSLSMRDYDQGTLDSFQFLVVDEVHNIATKTFSKMLQKMCPAHTLGLSATPKRPDGMSKVFHWFLGPMVFRRTAQEEASIRKAPPLQIRMLRFHANDRRFREIKTKEGQACLSVMLTNIAEIPSRNELVLRELKALATPSSTRYVLVLSSRIKQLEELHRLFKNDQVSSSMYVGSMKGKELKAVLEKETRVLFGTYELVQEGFDYPPLNTLIFATPRSRIEQAVGRILRRNDPDNTPIVVDIEDDLPSFRQQGQKRRRFYRSLGYTITECSPCTGNGSSGSRTLASAASGST